MGEALVGGLLAAGHAPTSMAVVEVVPTRRQELHDRWPGVAVVAEPVPASSALVAVKPGDVTTVCAGLAALGVQRVLSIAAGVTTATIAAAVGPGVAVLRAMPNTPATVGAGASALAAGPGATEQDRVWAAEVLRAVGTVVEVPEHLLDAVTGLSGSGPAYVFLVAEALIEGGVLAGLPRPVSRALTVQLLVGSAALLAAGEEGPEALRAAVTSPGGTTAEGLRALERAAVRSAFIEAVQSATTRARQLGGT